VPISSHKLVQSAAEAASAAAEVGFPIAMKIVSPDILHKFDLGGVKINIQDAEAAKQAYADIMASIQKNVPTARLDGILVDAMVQGQRKEVILGMKRNPQFGPMLMFGLGGIFVEILKDVSFRLTPLDHEEALKMISEIKAYKMLTGARGEEPSDLDAIAAGLVGLSKLVLDFPEIKELDINPFMVCPAGKGGAGVDVKMVIG